MVEVWVEAFKIMESRSWWYTMKSWHFGGTMKTPRETKKAAFSPWVSKWGIKSGCLWKKQTWALLSLGDSTLLQASDMLAVFVSSKMCSFTLEMSLYGKGNYFNLLTLFSTFRQTPWYFPYFRFSEPQEAVEAQGEGHGLLNLSLSCFFTSLCGTERNLISRN